MPDSFAGRAWTRTGSPGRQAATTRVGGTAPSTGPRPPRSGAWPWRTPTPLRNGRRGRVGEAPPRCLFPLPSAGSSWGARRGGKGGTAPWGPGGGWASRAEGFTRRSGPTSPKTSTSGSLSGWRGGLRRWPASPWARRPFSLTWPWPSRRPSPWCPRTPSRSRTSPSTTTCASRRPSPTPCGFSTGKAPRRRTCARTGRSSSWRWGTWGASRGTSTASPGRRRGWGASPSGFGRGASR